MACLSSVGHIESQRTYCVRYHEGRPLPESVHPALLPVYVSRQCEAEGTIAMPEPRTMISMQYKYALLILLTCKVESIKQYVPDIFTIPG
jgi:hypothetical protein